MHSLSFLCVSVWWPRLLFPVESLPAFMALCVTCANAGCHYQGQAPTFSARGHGWV